MMTMWDRVEQTLAGLLGVSALAFALWQAVSRYMLPRLSINFAEEVIVYEIIWAIMIVSSQLVRTDGHVRPDLVLKLVTPRVARCMEIFNSVAAIGFCFGLVWYGCKVVRTAMLIDERSASDLGFPMWIYYAALPAGGALMLMRFGIRLVELIGRRSPSTRPLGSPHGDELQGAD